MKDGFRTWGELENDYKREGFELLLRQAASQGGSRATVWSPVTEEIELRALNICHKYHLSRREGETVRFLIEGLTNKEIAARMGISPHTVKVFLRLAMKKMGVSSRSGIMSKFIHLKESDTGPGTGTSRTVHRPIPNVGGSGKRAKSGSCRLKNVLATAPETLEHFSPCRRSTG